MTSATRRRTGPGRLLARPCLAPLVIGAPLLIGLAGTAGAAPTSLVSCSNLGVPQIEEAQPGSASILLNPDGGARVRTTAAPVGRQPLGLVASGKGIIVTGEASEIAIAWICLLENEDRALFFDWVRTSPPSPEERCRTGATGVPAEEPAACLQRQLQAAEQDLVRANGRASQREAMPGAVPGVTRDAAESTPGVPPDMSRPDASRSAAAGPPRASGDAEWRRYRDAECGRRLDAAAPTEGSLTLLACLVDKTQARILELDGR